MTESQPKLPQTRSRLAANGTAANPDRARRRALPRLEGRSRSPGDASRALRDDERDEAEQMLRDDGPVVGEVAARQFDRISLRQIPRQLMVVSLIVVARIVLALLVGGIGLLVEGMFWLVVIAAVLLVAGAIAEAIGRGRAAL